MFCLISNAYGNEQGFIQCSRCRTTQNKIRKTHTTWEMVKLIKVIDIKKNYHGFKTKGSLWLKFQKEISEIRLAFGLFYCSQVEKGISTEISNRGLFTL